MISARTRPPMRTFEPSPRITSRSTARSWSPAPTDRVARAVISSIVRMAGDLGIETVAESVESDIELEAVRALGVDYAQGFLMGRPSSLAAFDFAAGTPKPN